MILKRNLLKDKTRKKLYDFISKNPGLHFREISRLTKIPTTTLHYHLKFLEKNNFVSVSSENRFNRYFVANKLGKREKYIIKCLRQETTRNILIYMMTNGIASQLELSKEIGKKPSTIDFHLSKLKKLDLIVVCFTKKRRISYDNEKDFRIKRKKVGNEIIYAIKHNEDVPLLANSLISISYSLENKKEIDEIIETTAELSSHYKLKKHVLNKNGTKGWNNLNLGINSAIDAFSVFFSPPFCS